MGKLGTKKRASKANPCPVCGSTGHCFEVVGGMEMGFGESPDHTPRVKHVTDLWMCMKAAGLGLVTGARGPHQPAINGYVAHGIRLKNGDFNQAAPGAKGGTWWYPSQFADDRATPIVQLDLAAIAARKAKAAEEERKAKEQDAYSLRGSLERWNGARSGENAPFLHEYFKARGIETSLFPGGRVPAALRYAPVLKHNPGQKDPDDPDAGKAGPGMLAIMTTPEGKMGGLHRTYFALDGSPAKRATGLPRLNSSNRVKEGTAIRLHDNPHADTLLVGEGVETMLAVLAAIGTGQALDEGGHDITPNVYSFLSAPGLMNLLLPLSPEGRTPIKRVVVCADLDEIKVFAGQPRQSGQRPGISAAITVAKKLKELAPDVDVVFTFATPADLPEALAAGEHDGLGELLPKVDGTRRKSIDPDDALALLVQRHRGDRIQAAHALAAMLARNQVPADQVIQQVERATLSVKSAFAAAEPPTSTSTPADSVMGTKTQGGVGDAPGGGGEDVAQAKSVGTRDRDPYRLLPNCPTARARIVLDECFRPGGAWPREVGEHVFDPTQSWFMRAREADANERWSVTYWAATKTWLLFKDGCYQEIEDEHLAALVRDYLAPFYTKPKKGGPSPCAISGRAVSDVMEAMKVETTLLATVLPAWAPATFDADGKPLWHTVRRSPVATGPTVIATIGGLIEVEQLHSRTLVMQPLTPRYVAMGVLPHRLPVDEIQAALDADPHGEDRLIPLAQRYAPTFIKSVVEQSENDDQWHTGVQRFGGNLLTDDMSYGMAALFLGVSGAGKGMIVEGYRTCHDPSMYAVASFGSMTNNFAREGWIGKSWLFMDECQAGRWDDKQGTTSLLKSIIVGEPITVDLKHKKGISSFQHKLRVVMTSDRMPEFIDPAAAMRRRLAVFPVRKKYTGAEDKSIRQRIATEGLGILIWSLGGLIDLKRAGHICMPDAGKVALHRLARNSSRPFAFLEDCCVQDPSSAVDADLLDSIYLRWCTRQRCEKPSVDKIFEGIAAVVDGLELLNLDEWMRGVRMERPPTLQTADRDGRRRKVYSGVRLRLRSDGDVSEGSALVVEHSQAWRWMENGGGGGSVGGWEPDQHGLAGMDIEAEKGEDVNAPY